MTLRMPLCFRECIILVPMWVLSAIRVGVGTDYYSYLYIVQHLAEYSDKMEPLSYLIFSVFGRTSINAALAVFSLLALIGSFRFLKSFSPQSNYAYLLYFCLPIYYLQTFNHVLQWAAIGVAYLGLHFLYNRRRFLAFVILVWAVAIHTSVVMLLPLYIFGFTPLTAKKVLIVTFCLAVVVLAFDVSQLFVNQIVSLGVGIYLTYETVLGFMWLIFSLGLGSLILWIKIMPTSIEPRLVNLVTNGALASIFILISSYFIGVPSALALRVNEVFVLMYIPLIFMFLETFPRKIKFLLTGLVCLIALCIFGNAILVNGEGYKLVPFRTIVNY
jgi:hypothetical protein